MGDRWFKVDTSIVRNPKVLQLSRTQRWALIELWAYSAEDLTDGVISRTYCDQMIGKRLRNVLIENDFLHWIEPDKTLQIHDYLTHQRSREQVLATSKKRSSAGRKGGKAKAARGTQGAGNLPDDAGSNLPDQPSSKNVADPDPDPDSYLRKFSQSPNEPRANADESEHEPGTEVVPAGGALVVLDDARPDPRRRIEIPDDWQPNDMHRARFPNVDHTEQADAFRDHAISVGRMCAGRAGWDSAFMSWLRKAPTTHRSTTDDRIRDALRVGEKYHEPDDDQPDQPPAIDYRRYLQ
ncbi:hypothetical protein SEA_BIBWIT_55 [Gordonia phage Bibwit]|uniref:Uncharacterized protein n=1 Tax=Gordonia phage Bibwit TaxID=2483666 RepID=A0A3G3M9A1_9CAUD|nr:replication initiation protein [Gordonia phage Bibwit]AYR02608.1 hypothetical protein SEA_BIBWIT_55 [Gordonia phage Bibwit]